MNILLVEDTKAVAETIFDYFENTQVTLDHAGNGILGLKLAQENHFDCIVLDIMLPGMDGLSVCQKLRKQGINTPIIMLTARDTNTDMLIGLRQGADDYVVKPFDLELLEARIEAVVRRSSNLGFNQCLTCGPLKLDIKTQQFWRDGVEIPLNLSCFKIISFLMNKHPEVATRQAIEEVLWDDELPDDDVLRKHIYQLRAKVDKPFPEELIKTVPKVGYKLAV